VSRHDPALHRQLSDLARAARIVIVAGLPGTGKSLVVHELAHLALTFGRPVDLLRWDVVRPVVEASSAGRRHPVVDAVTQPIIRVAVGAWARHAVATWARESASTALLVGEAPLVGGRLVELVRRRSDVAEPVLAATSCRFAIPVPSRDVRAFLESERERRATAPQHAREREDAPPHVLRDLWRQLVAVAEALGLVADTTRDAPYDPEVYRRVYETILGHRHRDVIALHTVLPTTTMSVHDVASACTDLVPDAEAADAAVREVERRHPDPTRLAQTIERWWADAADA
jgi:hypothetical protein